MSKCKLPARQVDALIDGVAGKTLFDACDGTYLGSVVPDPTPLDNASKSASGGARRCGANDCVLSYGAQTTGTPFTPDKATRVDPASIVGVLCLLIGAFAAHRFRKSLRARSRKSGST